MVSANLKQWIQHPELLDKDTLYELRMQLARYPYSQTLRVLYLKNLFMLRDASFGDELRRSVIYITDRSALFYIIEGNNFSLDSLRAAEEAVTEEVESDSPDRTLALINAFLATVPDETLEQQQVEFDYAADYTSVLLEELKEDEENGTPDSEKPQLKGIELIDGFIEENDKRQPAPLPLPEEEKSARVAAAAANSEAAQKLPDEEDDDSCFTETLAKIYIKQRRYEKALEIIKKLSLNYPKKNAYFADQIRFLDKLIINAKSK
jgi:tetratricopeptide (TPR) repeat protein